MSVLRPILPSSSIIILLLLWKQLLFVNAASSNPLLDATGQGTLQLQSVPKTLSTSKGIVTIINSPGSDTLGSSADILSIDTDIDDAIQLQCKGSTLERTSELERSSLAFCSLLSNAIIFNGIASSELDGSSFRDSRHSRTLTTLFRAKLVATKLSTTTTSTTETTTTTPTTLIFVCDAIDDSSATLLRQEVLALYQAAAAERSTSPTFSELYSIEVTSDFTKASELASKVASDNVATTTAVPAADVFRSAWTTVREPDVAASLSAGIDPPHVATAFVTVMNAHAKYTKTARAKIVSWKGRIARGLTIDSFGIDASALRKRCLTNGYDVETLAGAGLPQVAQYRLELRTQLQSLIDTAIEDCFEKQVVNIQAASVKRLQRKLLKNLLVDGSTYESNEAAITANAALLRQQTLAVEGMLESIQVPDLSLTKERAVRVIGAALNDALLAFPDSPAAKLQRTKYVERVVTKETKNKKKKPGQRSFGFGIDLVAMLRPDGFGSLQGFAGYSLPGGNSITFGVHNDADDPQVIAQFGGVRPPLLRVQPKLRIDVEL